MKSLDEDKDIVFQKVVKNIDLPEVSKRALGKICFHVLADSSGHRRESGKHGQGDHSPRATGGTVLGVGGASSKTHLPGEMGTRGLEQRRPLLNLGASRSVEMDMSFLGSVGV